MFDKKIEGYQRAYKKYGVDPRALQYRSEKSAQIRYRELVSDLNFERKSVLDVGCGFGDIITYIERKTKKFNYTGVDLVPEFVEVAKKKHPKHNFFIRDYFSNPLKESFDIVITSGTLNSNIEDAINFRKKAIKTIFKRANEAAAFNMAGSHPQPKNKESYRVYYVDSLKIIKFCLSLTSKLIVRHHYLPKDFTVIILK